MRQIRLCLLGCLPVLLVLAVASNSLGGAALSRDNAAARAAFLEAYKVSTTHSCCGVGIPAKGEARRRSATQSSSEKSASGWTKAARVQNKQKATPCCAERDHVDGLYGRRPYPNDE